MLARFRTLPRPLRAVAAASKPRRAMGSQGSQGWNGSQGRDGRQQDSRRGDGAEETGQARAFRPRSHEGARDAGRKQWHPRNEEGSSATSWRQGGMPARTQRPDREWQNAETAHKPWRPRNEEAGTTRGFGQRKSTREDAPARTQRPGREWEGADAAGKPSLRPPHRQGGDGDGPRTAWRPRGGGAENEGGNSSNSSWRPHRDGAGTSRVTPGAFLQSGRPIFGRLSDFAALQAEVRRELKGSPHPRRLFYAMVCW